MKTMGLSATRGYRKCAKIVGEVMGNFHPHGDESIYDTLVRHGAQDFNMRYTLVDGQGNFGSIDGDPPAASTLHTSAAPRALADDMMADLDKETVDFKPELRRDDGRADGSSGTLPEPARQRVGGHRGRHGDQRAAA